MDFKIHHSNSISVAELVSCPEKLAETDQVLDIMANASYNGAAGIILKKEQLHPDFFDLKTGLAGDILQKFSNYRMRLAVTGDFTGYNSKSLNDFIYESNKTGRIVFVPSLGEAIDVLTGGIEKRK